nr:unnamed protein product [Callosobruchus analis]
MKFHNDHSKNSSAPNADSGSSVTTIWSYICVDIAAKSPSSANSAEKVIVITI